MAFLKNSVVAGDLRVTGTIFGAGNLSSINANNTGLGTSGQVLQSTGTGIQWATMATSNHNHDSTYLKLSGGTLTGALTLNANPTANMHAATKQYVDNAFAANDAMIFKGTLGTGGTITSLPATHNAGWTYRVITASTYAGKVCEVGDLMICVTDSTSANDAHWVVAQTNIDGAVTGPATSTDAHVAVFSGTTGKLIKDSGFTIAKSVPSDAKFTDTTYGAEKGISLTSGKFGHSNTAITAQTTQAVYPIKIDAYGHITGYGSAQTILTIGTGASNAAAGNHTHTTSITSGGTSQINLSANTAYTLTAGGTTVVFKTPADGNTDTKVNVVARGTSKSYLLADTTSPTGTAAAHTAVAETGVYLTTTSGQLNATTYKVNEAVTLQYNSTTKSLDFIFA